MPELACVGVAGSVSVTAEELADVVASEEVVDYVVYVDLAGDVGYVWL